MEIIIQFGYVTLFASAYPLASLISIVANLIEIRSDAFRITYICQRPRSIRCDGLNMWNTLVRGIVRISALTNCLIFGFTSGQLMEWLPHLYQMDDTDHMRFNTDKGWIVIFIIFGLERILLWTGALLDASIPDVPEDVMNQLERKHFVLEEESREYEHQQESKRQKKS
jgi:anoctamin-10